MPDQGLFSLLRDAISREALASFMRLHGVDAQTARLAAEQCERAAVKNAGYGGAIGGLVALFASSPAGGQPPDKAGGYTVSSVTTAL